MATTEPDDLEVDFFKNPTILSRLILNEKYEAAARRLGDHPDEATVWVCVKRKKGLAKRGLPLGTTSDTNEEGYVYSMRQLPIHVACNHLLSVDSAIRKDLETLIVRLAVSYPEGCGRADHDGKMALHDAIYHNASPETVSVLLIAHPNALHERDRYGMTPLDLNHFKPGSENEKKKVSDLLMKGVSFWERAQQLAKSKSSVTHVGLQQDLASEEVEPITISRLERRAIHLEQLLNAMYEKKYESDQIIQDLRREKAKLQEQLKDVAPHSQPRAEDAKGQQHVPNRTTIKAGEVGKSGDSLELAKAAIRRLQGEVEELTKSNLEAFRRAKNLETIAISFKERGSSEDSEYVNLVKALLSNSYSVTERHLSRKIIRLEKQLSQALSSKDYEVAMARKENQRLVRENQALVSRASLKSQKPPKALPGNSNDSVSSSTESTEEFTLWTDDLQDILAEAAAMYALTAGSFEIQEQPVFDQKRTPLREPSSGPEDPREETRLNDRAARRKKKPFGSWPDRLPSESTTETSPDPSETVMIFTDDLDSILANAAQQYSQSDDLGSMLSNAAQQYSQSDDLDSRLSDVAQQHGRNGGLNSGLSDTAQQYSQSDDLEKMFSNAARQLSRNFDGS